MNIATLEDNPDILPQIINLHVEAWPKFISENLHRHSKRIVNEMPNLQIVALDSNNKLIAAAHTVSISWDSSCEKIPNGYDHSIDKAFADLDNKKKPTCLVAIAASIKRNYSGRGLGTALVTAMKKTAKEYGFSRMIAPVRPTWKSKYPLTSMDKYIQWKGKDDFFFDPWLRVHQKCGGKVIGICPESMLIKGTISQWEKWTNMKFFESGKYIVKDALCPITINCERDTGFYCEPNVWVSYNTV